MQSITYSEIAARHGRRPALQMLQTIERLANIKDEIISLDLDARFEKALKILSDIDPANADSKVQP
jgi:hypothetical protein